MAKKRSGAVRFLKGRWRARVTLGPDERPSFTLPADLTEADAEEAAERAAALSRLAAKRGERPTEPVRTSLPSGRAR